MTTPRKNCIATEAALFIAALCMAAAAIAAPAGVVTQSNGPLFTQSEPGRVKSLSADSEVSPGDTLVTGRETFAQVRFSDGGVLTLGPDTRLAVVAYAFDAAYITDDRSELRLETGSVRLEPGMLARRNPERYALVTPTGTIRGASGSFIATFVASDAKVAWIEPIRLAALSGVTMSDAPLVVALTTPVPGAKAPGLYVQVLDGIIHLTNGGGSQSFTAGQFGYTASFIKPPIVLPANPGMQFTPPPSFSSSTNSQGSSSNKSNSVDCEVR
ncbi:MAG TPA: FecR domain-containing protein [Usitatibacter sp.]|nr:FecR domain-containing protein [Usitatibacter sp.]